MTARTQVILTLLVSILICALFWFFMVKPRQDQLAEVKNDVTVAEDERQRLTAEVNRLQQLQNNRLELTTRLSQIRQFVPQEHEIPAFIFQVQDAALDSGVGFVQITPEQPRRPLEGAPLAQVRVTIGAGGGYFAIQDFVRRLHQLDRAVRVDVVNLTGRDDEEEVIEEGLIQLELAVRVFFELPAGAGGGTTTGTTTPTTVPATAEPTPTP